MSRLACAPATRVAGSGIGSKNEDAVGDVIRMMDNRAMVWPVMLAGSLVLLVLILGIAAMIEYLSH